MAEMAVVGRVKGHKFSKCSLKALIALKWTQVLGYAHVVCILPRGWFVVIFKSIGDSLTILNGSWSWGLAPIFLIYGVFSSTLANNISTLF